MKHKKSKFEKDSDEGDLSDDILELVSQYSKPSTFYRQSKNEVKKEIGMNDPLLDYINYFRKNVF